MNEFEKYLAKPETIPDDLRYDFCVALLTAGVRNRNYRYLFYDALLRVCKNHEPPSGMSSATEWIEAEGYSVRKRLLLKHKLEDNQPLDDREREWLLKFVKGDFDQQIFSAPKNQKLRETDGLFIMLMEAVGARYGLTTFRNDLSSRISSMDAIAQVFRDNNITPSSYSGVKSAFLKARREYRGLILQLK
jgi:hypothetical protein